MPTRPSPFLPVDQWTSAPALVAMPAPAPSPLLIQDLYAMELAARKRQARERAAIMDELVDAIDPHQAAHDRHKAECEHLATKCLAATNRRRSARYWRRLVDHTATIPPRSIMMELGQSACTSEWNEATRRELLGSLIDSGDLGGITAQDLLPMLQSPDTESRELAVRALHLVSAAR